MIKEKELKIKKEREETEEERELVDDPDGCRYCLLYVQEFLS